MTELALLTASSFTGTVPHADHSRVLLLETPAGERDFSVETLKHTRLSSWVRYALHHAAARFHGAVPPGLSRSTGVVSASRYGCVRATDETRKGQRAGGILGVDPIRFSKATHVYPLAANAIELGWRGPITAFVGDDETGWHALLFAAQQLAADAADTMYVVTYDEIDAAVLAHLQQSGALGGGSEDRCVAEALSVVALGRAERFPRHPTIRIDTVPDREDAPERSDDAQIAPPSPIEGISALGSAVIHWLARHAGAGQDGQETIATHTQSIGSGIGSRAVARRQCWRVRIASRREGEKQ